MQFVRHPNAHLGSEITCKPRRRPMTPEARIHAEADQLGARWREDPRWHGIERTYGAAEGVRLRGSIVPEQALARPGGERLGGLVQGDQPVRGLRALTRPPAVPAGRAG